MKSTPLIGMLHLPRLRYDSPSTLEAMIEYSLQEVGKLSDLGFHGVMVENFNDTPFEKSRVSDYVYTHFAVILRDLKRESKIPIGVNVLRNGSAQALTLATVLDLDFIRVNIWEGAYVTDQGIIEGAAAETMNLKIQYNSTVKILADVHVKHAHQLGNFSILDSAENALLRGGADAVIVSGPATGKPPSLDILKQLSSERIKPIIGSGLQIENLPNYKNHISGGIIGTSIKDQNKVTNPIDITKATEFIETWNSVFS